MNKDTKILLRRLISIEKQLSPHLSNLELLAKVLQDLKNSKREVS